MGHRPDIGDKFVSSDEFGRINVQLEGEASVVVEYVIGRCISFVQL